MDDKLAVNFTSRVTLKAKKGDNDLRLRTTLKTHAHTQIYTLKCRCPRTSNSRLTDQGGGGVREGTEESKCDYGVAALAVSNQVDKV